MANNSGVAYEQAELKLLAGDVNLVQPAEDIILNYAEDRLGEDGAKRQSTTLCVGIPSHAHGDEIQSRGSLTVAVCDGVSG